jgi:NDP-sugar pyrophosphorylase family protein
MEQLDVVILCGGQGTRLRSVVWDRPKPMAEISGRPFLDLLIDYASSYGLTRFVLCTGYQSEIIERYYQRYSGPLTIIISKEDAPLGTGGGVKLAGPKILSDPFFVLNGDSYCPADLEAFTAYHLSRQASITLVVSETKTASDFGSIIMEPTGRITSFQEKISAGRSLINAGIYLMKRSLLFRIPDQINYSLEKDLFPILAGNDMYGFISSEPVLDIGTPDRYDLAKKLLSGKKYG